MSQQQHHQIIEAIAPSEETKLLVSIFADVRSKQLEFLDESAKQIIERIATLLAVLFAVTALGNSFPPPYLKGNLPAKVLVIATLVFYLVAMGAGMWAVQPRRYKVSRHLVEEMRTELEAITAHKMWWLRLAGLLFTMGSIALAALIVSIIWIV